MTIDQHLRAVCAQADSATNIADVADYFLEHLGGDPAFARLGTRARQPALDFAFEQIARMLTGRPASGSESSLVSFEYERIAAHGLWHGAIVGDGMTGLALYFEESDLAIFDLWSPKRGRDCFRVRLCEVPEPSADAVWA